MYVLVHFIVLHNSQSITNWDSTYYIFFLDNPFHLLLFIFHYYLLFLITV